MCPVDEATDHDYLYEIFGNRTRKPVKLPSRLNHRTDLLSDRMALMEPTRELGRMMVFAGIGLAAIGALVWLGARRGGFPLRLGRFPLRLGRLPGDIAYQGKHGSFYFPLVTCILVSVALTLIMWLVQWLKK